MSVPKFDQFFEAFLKKLADGQVHSSKEVKEYVAEEFNLSEEDLQELVPSGRSSRFNNRVLWARTYLNKAGLIETPSRGHYLITPLGQQALQSGERIDLNYLQRFDAFNEFHNSNNSSNEVIRTEQEEEESPVEILETAFSQINDSLASELMKEVMKLTPTDFEKLVVKLLLKMGYGNGIEEAGTVTPATRDGGIDGIIKEDQLGFSNIYIQAKQWDLDHTIQRQHIQSFVGALQGQQAQKGLFITTSKFSDAARRYASNLLGTKVVLIDGDVLTKLMIKHNVGVSVEQVYEIKKIDSDFFSDEF